MRRRFVLLALLVVAPLAALPQAALAQSPPERLLPSGSQIYLRWDGVDAHRAAFDKTALGQMLKEDTGKFLSALWTYANELLDHGLKNADPNALALAKEAPKILAGMAHHGLLLGVEVKSVSPPQVEAAFVFPKAGGKDGALLPVIDKLIALSRAEVRKTKVGNREVSELMVPVVKIGWWNENDSDVVFVIGTTSATDYAKNVDAGGFSKSATVAAMNNFKEFEVWARGFIDVTALLGKVGELAPQADQLIGELGLKGLKSISFHSGFDGPAERSVVEVDMPGPRKGLLALVSRKTIKLSDLPPMPSDLTSFSASNFNVKSLYDGGVAIAEAAVNVFAGGAVDVKELIKQAEAILGVRFSEDLFGSFDDLSVGYNSPAEGPISLLGGAYIFKVKDSKKLGDTLDGLFKAIPPLPGLEISLKKRKYHGGEIMDLRMKTDQGEQQLATMTIHKGWFMLGGLPQSVYGFILRSEGKLPTWKADAELTKRLAALPKDFTAIYVSDPRPSAQFLLSLAPTALSLANSVLPQVSPGAPTFDLSLIPHAQFAVRPLFHNITIMTDDGKKIRSDTRASLALPF